MKEKLHSATDLARSTVREGFNGYNLLYWQASIICQNVRNKRREARKSGQNDLVNIHITGQRETDDMAANKIQAISNLYKKHCKATIYDDMIENIKRHNNEAAPLMVELSNVFRTQLGSEDLSRRSQIIPTSLLFIGGGKNLYNLFRLPSKSDG